MRKIAFTNQKGGVGKTTTTINTGAGLANLGYKVLLVDMDPQANLTYSLKLHSNRIDKNIYHVLKGEVTIESIVMKHTSFDILPSSIELSGAEMELVNMPAREILLKDALTEVEGKYDYVLIDCPPSLGILTINGLTAAQEVVIPLQCEALSHRGVGQLLETLRDIRHFTNPHLEITEIVDVTDHAAGENPYFESAKK
jgi:chromosome partitioning protein